MRNHLIEGFYHFCLLSLLCIKNHIAREKNWKRKMPTLNKLLGCAVLQSVDNYNFLAIYTLCYHVALLFFPLFLLLLECCMKLFLQINNLNLYRTESYWYHMLHNNSVICFLTNQIKKQIATRLLHKSFQNIIVLFVWL